MSDAADNPSSTSRRAALASGAALLGATILGGMPATAQPGATPASAPGSAAMPPGYNILFVLVDQEHFFPTWPFPVPAREAIKKKAITFLNHQAASCVCSSARSVIYTGQHVQHTGIADNLNYIWQRDLATGIKTIGHRLAELGYHAAYQGKWHLSANLDLVDRAIDAPLGKYRETIDSYGFKDFFGVGDLIDRTLGGYHYDDSTLASAVTWLRTHGQELRVKSQPWYMAVNFVNPHDVMYFDSDLATEKVQGRSHVMPIARAPDDEIYRATWDDQPLPASRRQPFDQAGRPAGQRFYQQVLDLMVGQWPDEDRRWRALRDYYFNAIRDCDRKVALLLEALRTNGMDKNTIVIFTADHGELGGNHQMRGKGTNTYRQQNHLPLMILHDEITVPLRIDREIVHLLGVVLEVVNLDVVHREKLFQRSRRIEADRGKVAREAIAAVPDAADRRPVEEVGRMSGQQRRLLFRRLAAVRTGVDGQRRPLRILIGQHVEVEQRRGPDRVHASLTRVVEPGREILALQPFRGSRPGRCVPPGQADDRRRQVELRRDRLAFPAALECGIALNQETNRRIAEEVGDDDGRFLPIRDGKWRFPPASDR